MSAPAEDDFVQDPTRGWRMGCDCLTAEGLGLHLLSCPNGVLGEFAASADVEIPEADA